MPSTTIAGRQIEVNDEGFLATRTTGARTSEPSSLASSASR